MPYLRLRDLRAHELHEFEVDLVRLGRKPDLELVPEGVGSEVVSGSHAQFAFRDGAWWIEDIGGRNGTFLEGKRVGKERPQKVAKGQVVALGQQGPRYEVDAVQKTDLDATLLEQPLARPSAETMPMPATGPEFLPEEPETAPIESVEKPPPPQFAIVMRDARSGTRYDLKSGRVRIGRGKECELRPVEGGDTSVSRVHCEIVLKPDGAVVLRDAQSRNGTLLNGERISGDSPLSVGDTVQLGNAGSKLVVETLDAGGRAAAPAEEVAPAAPAADAPPPVADASPPAPDSPPAEKPSEEEKAAFAAAAADRRSFGGKGRTIFFKEMIHATEKKSADRVRVLIWSFVVVMGLGVGGVYWWSERRVRQTEVELAAQREALAAQSEALERQRAFADSVQLAATAEYQRLGDELAAARSGSAPAAVVDSLRAALSDAQARTTALETALERAQASVDAQLAAGDSLRAARQDEIERLRSELASSTGGGNVSRELIDSLRQTVADAERRAAEIEAGLRAVRGADLAHIARANQGAVGLVSTFSQAGIFDGSGFAITASGYFVTNRHVATPEGQRADSVFVTMADQRLAFRADVIAVQAEPGPDLALLKIRGYSGPYVPRVDWEGTRAQQGEPAALIGFPAGVAAALDRTRTVRTSMSAGIFSKVTPELIQFDGFTVGGSSGSPIFNAAGDVVAVHYAGLRQAAGLAFTVPVNLVAPLLPAEARREVGNDE